MKITYKATAEFDRQDVCDFLTLEQGGWSFWGYIDYKEADYYKAKDEMKAKGVEGSFKDSYCYEDVIAYMIMDTNYKVWINDFEEEKRYQVTKAKLKKGFELNAEKRPHDASLEDGDTTTGDCIMQYAIFGDIIYG